MKTTKPIYVRLFIFFKERFTLLVYIPFVVFLYLCMSFSIQALEGGKFVFDKFSIVGLVSAFAFMLMMRTFDELKDFELDKDIFPNRPAPRGDVLKSDLHLLAITSFAVLVLTNLIFARETLIVFTIVITYAVLSFKWFFAEKFHLSHLFFTMLTHQPIPYLINFYLLHTALASGATYESFSLTHFLFLMMYSVPVTIWETSRKIRTADIEDGYQTFSKIWGSSKATFIPLVAVIITSALNFYAGIELELFVSFFVINIATFLYAIFFYLRFIFKPIIKFNNLQTTATIYSVLVFVNLLGHLVAKGFF